jgi:hypothetical protein
MKLEEIPNGNYNARAVGGMFDLIGPNKTPAVVIGFEFKVGELPQKIRHTMWLTVKQLEDGSTVAEKTFDTLARLGFDNVKPLLTLQDGRQWFDKTYLADKEVEIVIEQGEYNGQPQTRVKWVNEIGGAQLGGLPVHQVLPGVNVAAMMAAAKARMGVKKPPPEKFNSNLEPRPGPKQKHQQDFGNMKIDNSPEDIPF